MVQFPSRVFSEFRRAPALGRAQVSIVSGLGSLADSNKLDARLLKFSLSPTWCARTAHTATNNMRAQLRRKIHIGNQVNGMPAMGRTAYSQHAKHPNVWAGCAMDRATVLSQAWRALRRVSASRYRCKSSMISMCDATGMIVFATHMPLAATAGVPTPGNTESPQQNMLSSGLTALGSAPAIVSRFFGPVRAVLAAQKARMRLGAADKGQRQALVDVWNNLQACAVIEVLHNQPHGPDMQSADIRTYKAPWSASYCDGTFLAGGERHARLYTRTQ